MASGDDVDSNVMSLIPVSIISVVITREPDGTICWPSLRKQCEQQSEKETKLI
jgi:hypothetical protein